jgi:hypothetical protein
MGTGVDDAAAWAYGLLVLSLVSGGALGVFVAGARLGWWSDV